VAAGAAGRRGDLVVNGSFSRSRTTAAAMRRAKRSSPYSESTRASAAAS